MQTPVTQPMNFKEYVASRGFNLSGLARRTKISYWPLNDRIAIRGDASLKEAEALCEALGCDQETLKAVLQETARRPGERDARGRKKQACGGTTNGGASSQ